jgi:microcompartment protein CcmK/EutM
VSWDACLYIDVAGEKLLVGEWNYTHNCNQMMASALEDVGAELEDHWLIGHMGKSWFKALNGRSGAVGAEVLKIIRDAFAKEPDRFRAMDPPNGWGNFNSVRWIIADMLAASRRFPSGTWWTGG